MDIGKYSIYQRSMLDYRMRHYKYDGPQKGMLGDKMRF